MSNGKTAQSYRVLARKYRPMHFGDLIGQEPMVRTLTNAFQSGRIAQAYMLTGVRGVGKTTTARILARALNYQSDDVDRPTIDLQQPGLHCEAIMAGNHVDVIEMDAASHTGIDDIREIIEQVRYRPVSARYKVYIIDEVHMLSTQAFNGLLKTLEEPPEHVKFIFATTEIRKVPVTVLSRCQRFDLRRIEAGALVAHFKAVAEQEGIAIDDEALAMIARAAEGSARDGLSLLDQAIAHGAGGVSADAVRAMLGMADRARIVDLFELVAKGDVAAALATFRELYDAGANPVVVLNDLADFTHLVTRLKFVPEASKDAALSETERARGTAFAAQLSVPALSVLWQMLLKGIAETESANRPVSACEMVLIRLTHAANLPGPADAVRAIAGGSSTEAVAEGAPRGADAPVAPVLAPPSAVQSPRSRGAGPTALLRPVAGNGSAPVPGIEATPVPEVAIDGLGDLAALAGQRRDAKMKAMIRKYLRPVKIEPGRLEIALVEDAPKSLIGELDVRLRDWTGRRWVIAISREAGGATLEEAERAEFDDRLDDAGKDPDVAAILSRFPGARIRDVRIRADELDERVPAVQSEDGDILPDDPQDDY